MSRSSRLLLLLQNLTTCRQAVTAAKISAELNVSERTVYRDLGELASQGVRVAGEAGVGYRLKPGFFLPPLMLTKDEAEAVLLGLDYVHQRGADVLLKAGLNAREDPNGASRFYWLKRNLFACQAPGLQGRPPFRRMRSRSAGLGRRYVPSRNSTSHIATNAVSSR